MLYVDQAKVNLNDNCTVLLSVHTKQQAKMDVLKTLVEELKSADPAYSTLYLHRINKLSDILLS